MIYEKYYPSEKNKQWKIMINDQFKYHRDNYLNDHKIYNIYELSNRKSACEVRVYNNLQYVRYKRSNFLDYLLDKCKFTTKRIKINRDQRQKISWKRARKDKHHAFLLKNIIN